MKIPSLTPVLLRQVLSASLFLTFAAGAGLFYLATDNLGKTAKDVSETTAEAHTSQSNIEILQQLSKVLGSNKENIEQAAKVRADTTAYGYQDQIIKDLNTYASKAGVTIKNIDFAAPTVIAGKPAVTVGPKTVPVAITLTNPLEYSRLLNFINSIEQSLTKMQLSSINVVKAADTNNVTSDTLNLALYIQDGSK